MPLGDYLSGLAWFCAMLATVAATTIVVDRRWLRSLAGEVRILAIFLVATAALVVVHLLPLILGVLTQATPVVTGALLGLALWRFLPTGRPVADGGPPPGPPSGRVAWTVAGVACGAAAIGLVAYAYAVAVLPFDQIDVVNFHLPVVARWIQRGSLWGIDQFLAYQAQGNYPQTGDVVHLATVLPWRMEFAVRYVAPVFAAITGVGVYALGRELRAPAATAATFGAFVVAMPTVIVSNVDFELTDVIMYATFVAGVVFLARHVRTRSGLDLALAGLGLGLSFGVKWYAVSSVVVVLAVWVIGLLIARRPWRPVVSDAAKVAGLVLAVGGIWLLRNWVESGNPVFPQPVRVLGLTIFDAPYDLFRHLAGKSLLDYVDRPSVFRHYALPDFNRTWSYGWWLLVAGCVVALARALRPGQPDRRVVGVVVAAGVLAVVYLATPYTALGTLAAGFNVAANTRYGVPALILAMGATAWVAGGLGRAGVAVDLLAAAAVADSLRKGYDAVGTKHWAVGIVVVLAAGGGWLAWRRRPPRGWALAGAGAAALLVAAAAGYGAQRRFVAHRYPHPEPPLAFIGDHHQHRVALAGLWEGGSLSPVYPSFGPRLHNRVDFVGPWRQGMLKMYLAPGPFVAALRRGRYDLVVVGRTRRPVATDVEHWPALAGYREVGLSDRLVLYAKR
jgi:hypothetical protein